MSSDRKRLRKEIDIFDCCDGDKVTRKSADEEIAERVGGSSRVPVKLRDDKFSLPDSDLLKVLHYYISHKYPNKTRIFEETSLLVMGLLVEHWMEEVIGETSAGIYAGFVNGNAKNSQTPSRISKRRRTTFKRQKTNKTQDNDSNSSSSSDSDNLEPSSSTS